MKEYRRQYYITCCAYIGQILVGFVIGWSAPVMTKLESDPDLVMNERQMNFTMSSSYIGALLGTILIGILSNLWGRKRTILLGGLMVSVAFLGLMIIKNVIAIIFFRAITGLGMATSIVLNLVYLGEIASKEIRGMLLGGTGIFNSLGFILAYSVGPFVSYVALNAIGLAIGILYLVGTCFVPESPVYFIIKGEDEKAKATYLTLGRKEDADRLSEVKLEIQETIDVKWTQLFRGKCNRKALVITSTLFFGQHMSGATAISSYATKIFEISGSSVQPYVATIILGIVQLVSGFLTPLFVERCGRRILLLLSTSFDAISLMVLAVYFYLDISGNPVTEQLKWLPLTCCIAFFFSHSFGFAVLPNTLVGEMFELKVRSLGTSVVLSVAWISGLASMSLFGYIITKAEIYVAFFMFGTVCGCAFLFTLVFVPETKGKSLIEVQKMLS